MEMKKLHLGTICFSHDTSEEVLNHLEIVFDQQKQLGKGDAARRAKGRRDISTRTKEIVQALALCHNVTPVVEEGVLTYQASSPDEVSIVKWTETVGLTLYHRDLTCMQLKTMKGDILNFDVLHVFPFTSELKRMGIIVRDTVTNEITFYQKGADSIMSKIVQYNDWYVKMYGMNLFDGELYLGWKRSVGIWPERDCEL
jgi:phospholipid-translocating ATPase